MKIQKWDDNFCIIFKRDFTYESNTDMLSNNIENVTFNLYAIKSVLYVNNVEDNPFWTKLLTSSELVQSALFLETVILIFAKQRKLFN